MNETWGIKEAAAFLRIHPDTLVERARAGEIPGCKVGRAWVQTRWLERDGGDAPGTGSLQIPNNDS